MKSKKVVKVEAARSLRKEMTEAERVLWKYLSNKGMCITKFRRQHIIDGFILDFYCPSCKLGIEIDGSIHDNQKEYDNARQEVIESRGIQIMRFSNKQVLEDVESVLKSIKHGLFPLYEVERDVPKGQGEE